MVYDSLHVKIVCVVYLMPLANLQVDGVAAWHVAPLAPQQGFC